MKEKGKGGAKRKVNLTYRFTQFELPPIQNALIIGRRAPVGSNGTARAFQEMAPGMFRLVKVDHPAIEGILIRECDLRKLPETDLINRLVHHAEQIMGDGDILHVAFTLEVVVKEEGIDAS